MFRRMFQKLFHLLFYFPYSGDMTPHASDTTYGRSTSQVTTAILSLWLKSPSLCNTEIKCSLVHLAPTAF